MSNTRGEWVTTYGAGMVYPWGLRSIQVIAGIHQTCCLYIICFCVLSHCLFVFISDLCILSFACLFILIYDLFYHILVSLFCSSRVWKIWSSIPGRINQVLYNWIWKHCLWCWSLIQSRHHYYLIIIVYVSGILLSSFTLISPVYLKKRKINKHQILIRLINYTNLSVFMYCVHSPSVRANNIILCQITFSSFGLNIYF
jgi:hypothetical protein